MSLASGYKAFTTRYISVPVVLSWPDKEYRSEGTLLDLQPDELLRGRPSEDLTFFVPPITQKLRITQARWPLSWRSASDAEVNRLVDEVTVAVVGYEYRVRGSSVRHMKKVRSHLDLLLSELYFQANEEQLRFNFQSWVRQRRVFSHYGPHMSPQYDMPLDEVQASVRKRGGDEMTDFDSLSAEAITRADVLQPGDVLTRNKDTYVVSNTEPQGSYQRSELRLGA